MTYRIENQDLIDIIYQIDDLYDYFWNIQWFEGVSKESINVLDIEKKINNSENGILINSQELIEFTQPIKQITEIILIGDKNKGKLFRYFNDSDAKMSCEFFIEQVDSSYWEVTSNNLLFIESIIKKLAAVEI